MRILFVSNSRPYPPTNGGSQRTAHLLSALREIGEVHPLFLPYPEQLEVHVKHRLEDEYALLDFVPMPRRSQLGWWRWLRPLHPSVVDRLAHHLGRKAYYYRPHAPAQSVLAQAFALRSYDVIVGRYLRPTSLSGALAYGPVILDVDDLDYDVWRRRANDPGASDIARMIYRHHYRQLQRAVPPLLRKCAHLWVSNAVDIHELDGLPTRVLPNIPFCVNGEEQAPPLPANPQSRVILTVASLVQKRNVEGIDYFVTEVWPLIRRQMPDAVFRIVGQKLSPTCRARWGSIEGVEPVGFVEDLSEAYRACAFTVAPLFYGGGTNIKVLESLAFCRTCVVTPFVYRGFEETLSDGEALSVAHDALALAEACITLLEQPERAAALAQRGACLVAEHYSYARFRNIVHDTVREVTEHSHGVQPKALMS